MSKQNGGIIGPNNIPTGAFGSASGVWKLSDAINYKRQGTWPIALSGHQVANSLRGTRGASNYLSRTFSTGNRDTWTWSTWLKKSSNGNVIALFAAYPDSNNFSVFNFTDDDTLQYHDKAAGSTQAKLATNRVFRDNSAWYHIVLVYDSGNSTSGNRVRLYINGVEETSFGTDTMPGQNNDSTINRNVSHNIGTDDTTGYYLDCYLAEVVFIDGQALDPTSFGEFNSQTGIWVPKVVTGLTFGTNGFYLPFTNASAFGEDFSGEDHDFTVTNFTSIDQSTDTCTNNFATLNPLYPVAAFSYSEGNLKGAASSSGKGTARGTIGIQDSGKWYFEVKITTDDACGVGISNEDMDANTWQPTSGTFVIYHNNGTKVVNGTASSYGATYGDGDIIGVAYNADDAEITFYKNGASQGTITGVTTGKFMLPSISDTGTSSDATLECNFGSPSFAISSGNVDSSGLGNFEYAVPEGFYSLCTKNLNLIG